MESFCVTLIFIRLKYDHQNYFILFNLFIYNFSSQCTPQTFCNLLIVPKISFSLFLFIINFFCVWLLESSCIILLLLIYLFIISHPNVLITFYNFLFIQKLVSFYFCSLFISSVYGYWSLLLSYIYCHQTEICKYDDQHYYFILFNSNVFNYIINVLESGKIVKSTLFFRFFFHFVLYISSMETFLSCNFLLLKC